MRKSAVGQPRRLSFVARPSLSPGLEGFRDKPAWIEGTGVEGVGQLWNQGQWYSRFTSYRFTALLCDLSVPGSLWATPAGLRTQSPCCSRL